MKNIIYILFSLIAGITLFLSVQSCDCPCDNEVVREFVCQPRDITINEFIPDLLSVDPNDVIISNTSDVVQSISYNPVDSFSIHTFQFPNDPSTSGSLPNDPRVQSDYGISYVPLAKVPVSKVGPDIAYFVAYISRTPANKDIVGDILVEDIDLKTNPADPSAFLKFAGSLYRIPNQNMPSESSREFCEYLEDNQLTDEAVVLTQYRANLSEYGAAYGDEVVSNFDIQDMVILNQNNQIIAYRSGALWVFRSINIDGIDYYFLNENTRNSLISDLNKINISKANEELQEELSKKPNIVVEAKLGDMFFYRAINGRDFIMSIINISEKQIGTAYKKRVSIMFNEI